MLLEQKSVIPHFLDIVLNMWQKEMLCLRLHNFSHQSLGKCSFVPRELRNPAREVFRGTPVLDLFYHEHYMSTNQGAFSLCCKFGKTMKENSFRAFHTIDVNPGGITKASQTIVGTLCLAFRRLETLWPLAKSILFEIYWSCIFFCDEFGEVWVLRLIVIISTCKSFPLIGSLEDPLKVMLL